ncbi:multidrug efflux pump [Bradyrhizobium sp. GM22.5]
MGVSEPFIRRPIATSLLGIALLIGGLLGYFALPVSALPQVDFPTVQVTTQLPGASPDVIASLITAPLERQLGQIPSLSAMNSTSSFGVSQISLQFDLNRDIDGATQDVQAAINAAAGVLPKTLPYPPTYAKVNPADAPVMTLALRSDTISLRAMSDIADTLLAQRLSQISGVGRVSVLGGLKPAVRIQADLARLAAYGIAMEDLRTAIASANVSGPKGSLDGAQQSYIIAANDQIAAADAYKPVIIAYRNGSPVTIADVAQIVDGLENDRTGGWYQGSPAVIIDIQRQPGANVIDVVSQIRAEIPKVQRAIPAGVNLTIVSDRTVTIRASVRDVQFTLILSVVLVTLVVLLFLRSLRATLIAGVALPLSLITSFGIMYFAGFSLDNLSLMALTIGTGFVVDDAIVMIENIVRHMENGDSAMEASLKGASEIGFTVISLTVSLIAVFIPLLFMSGLVGRMFREFALTLTIAVVTSAVVSLTLTPMMCSRLLKHAHEELAVPGLAAVSRFIDRTVGFYHRTLLWVLERQRATLVVTFATLIATLALYVVAPKGFLPLQDTASITAVTEAGPDVSFAEMQKRQAEAADAIKADPDVTGVVSVIGAGSVNPTTNVGRLVMTLKPRGERRDDVSVVITRLKERVAAIPGMTIYFQPVQDVQISTQSSRSQYQYTLTGTDAALVSEWARKLVAEMRRDPLFRDVSSEAQEGGLRAQLTVDRTRAGQLGVSLQGITDTLNDAFAQRQISTIYGQANQYRVVLEALPMYQRDPSILSKLYLPGAASATAGAPNAQVPLSAVATLTRTTAPLAISHQAQFPSISLSFNLAPGAALGDAVEAVKTIETRIEMPNSIVGVYAGDAAEFAKALAGQPWLLLAAVITIYIVLGVLYESYIHPITILSTLPSAGVGAILALMLCGQDLSVIGLIGIILLMGHRQEERDHDDRLRARGRARAGDVAERGDRTGLSAALPSDHDDDAGRPVRCAAAGDRERHRRRAALPTRHLHYRRPAAQPIAHALHHAGDLSRPRPHQPPPRAGAAAGRIRRSARRGRDRGDAVMASISEPFIRRPVATTLLSIGLFLLGIVAYEFLPVASVPNIDFSRHLRLGQPSWRRPVRHGRDGCLAAGAAARRDRGHQPDHLDFVTRHDQHPAPVRHRPQRRQSRPRRAGGNQCVAGRPAERFADAAALPQGEHRRRAGLRAGADLEDAVRQRGLRRRRHRAGAAHLAGAGGGQCDDLGCRPAGGQDSAQSCRAVQCRHRHRRRANCDYQRQPARSGRHLQRRAPERDAVAQQADADGERVPRHRHQEREGQFRPALRCCRHRGLRP